MRFNPKAKIDESQIEDRTPSSGDIREKFIRRGKYGISSRGGRSNAQMEAIRRRMQQREN